MPKGEAQRMQYKKGMERPGRPIPPEGDYEASVKSIGKKGEKGWKTKPGKFPNRMVLLTVHGAEGPDGEDMEAPVFIQPNPKTFFNVFDIASAFAAETELDLEPPKNHKDMPRIRAACASIDELLEEIAEGEKTAKITISHEEYKGRTNARVTFHAPSEEEVTESEDESEEDEDEEKDEEKEESEETDEDADTDEDEDEDEETDEDEADSDDDEEDTNPKGKKKPAAKVKTATKKGGKKK